jgi:hypothetical protein
VIFLGLQGNYEFMPKFYVALRASCVTFPKFSPKFSPSPAVRTLPTFRHNEGPRERYREEERM